MFLEVVLKSVHDPPHYARIFLLNYILFAEIVDNLILVRALRYNGLIIVSIRLIILQLRRLKFVNLALSWVT